MAKIYRGDTFTGVIQLRQRSETGITGPYVITPSSVIEVHFPAENSGSPVILSTANSGEITIADSALSTIVYKGSPAKSLLLKLGEEQDIQVEITTPTLEVTTFVKEAVLQVLDRPNG
jgi:hypothetical protein